MEESANDKNKGRKYMKNEDFRSCVFVKERALEEIECDFSLMECGVEKHGGWTEQRHRDYSTRDLPVDMFSTRGFVIMRKLLRKRSFSFLRRNAGSSRNILILRTISLCDTVKQGSDRWRNRMTRFYPSTFC